MFERALSQLSSLVIHKVGNRLKDDELVLSENESGLDEPTEKIVWDYVFAAFKAPDFYQFTHSSDLELNNVYSIARSVFNQPDTFIEKSAALAKLLYEASQHPQVKSGELMVMYFKKLRFAQIEAPAIGLFKSEKKQPFLFTESQDAVIDLYSYQGISPSKVDKAALIFNDSEEDGFNVLCVDNLNKGEETKFWFDDFLKLKSRSTEYAKTSHIIDITKSFIDVDLSEEAGLDRSATIDFLNKSKDYFKENEEFNCDDFSEKVFEDEAVGARFKEYAVTRNSNDLRVEEGFAISPEAVKKKQRVFKSVLKLDKNFHIYIHGNRDLIEKGVDENGRQYYKLYFEEEA